jgi:cysteinyl-tRNA synthetase
VYDTIYRVLKAFYEPQRRVIYTRNITDVDDKILDRARQRGISPQALTAEVTEIFHAQCKVFNCLEPDFEPRATQYIPQMVSLIERLIEAKHAYIAGNGDVFFDVKSYADYGKLSGRNTDELLVGARVEENKNKRNPLDFTLWKLVQKTEYGFETVLGYGLPGWHIECSAMSADCLGETFDIHGGGADLKFPHHENEIAQARCGFKEGFYAKYWIHNGFLMVDGQKMSKSLGNFTTPNEIFEKGYTPEAVRLSLLSTHYSKPLDFTFELLERQEQGLKRFYAVIEDNWADFEEKWDEICPFADLPNEAQEALTNDFNTPKLIAFLHSMTRDITYTKPLADRLKLLTQFVTLGRILGLFYKRPNPVDFTQTELYKTAYKLGLERVNAKKNKDFATSDKLRAEIEALGFKITDTKDGFEIDLC